jgi:hypothetical protein
MNKIEEYKNEKDGLDILLEVPRYAAEGWEAITNALIVVGEAVRLGRELHWVSETVVHDPSSIMKVAENSAELVIREIHH